MNDETNRLPRWEMIAAFLFGVTFLSICILMAWFKPNPTITEYRTYMTVLALSAAGVGAILPGFLNVHFKNWLRAGGALALFVLVYFFSPSAPASFLPEPAPVPSGDPQKVAIAWLHLVDESKHSAAYESMADQFKSMYSFQVVSDLLGRERISMGKPKERVMVYVNNGTNDPSKHYQQITYKTQFDREPQTIYEQVVLVSEKGLWRPVGYTNFIKNASGIWEPYEPSQSSNVSPVNSTVSNAQSHEDSSADVASAVPVADDKAMVGPR